MNYGVLHHVPEKIMRPPELRECARAGGVTGLFAAEGDQWRLENRLVWACLNQHNLQDYLEAMKIVSGRLMEKWKVECEQSDSIAITLWARTRGTPRSVDLILMSRVLGLIN